MMRPASKTLPRNTEMGPSSKILAEMRPSTKTLSRDIECCKQLQSPGQFHRIKVFESNPSTLHKGGQCEEFKCINVYPPEQKSNPSRRNAFGKWHSFKKIAEIKEDIQGKNIMGYKQEYDFVDHQGNKNGLKMREYTRHKRGENDYSYCVIYKKKKYDYIPKSEERASDVERLPNEEHGNSSAAHWPSTVQRRESTTPVVSQNYNLGPAILNASNEKINRDSMERFIFAEDSELQIDPNSGSNIQRYSTLYNEFSELL